MSGAKTHGFISDDSTPMMLKENNTAKHFWSDRCVGQFKNKFLKRFMKEKAKKKRTNIHHNYFQSFHGKGACDSECGVLKKGQRNQERHDNCITDRKLPTNGQEIGGETNCQSEIEAHNQRGRGSLFRSDHPRKTVGATENPFVG